MSSSSSTTAVLKRENSADKLIEKKARLNQRRNSEEIDKFKLQEVKGLSKEGAPPATWWIVGAYVVFNHIVALYAFFFVPASWQIKLATFLTYWCTGFGITAGYHRLWSHRAYEASLPLRIALAILGTNAYQGSIKWWVLRHRLHHRYTDTEHDPYNSQRGFYYAHMGWLFEKPYYPRMKYIDASDLNADPVVRFQHKYIVLCLLATGYLYPAVLGWYLGDWFAGVMWIGFIERVFLWHCTWSINSFCHWMGEKLFCDSISARGNLACALITMGEGYHNFHHEFPKDYRNGVLWYDYDPTKWSIRLWYLLGLASNLHRASKNSMQQARVQVNEARVARERARLNWGPTVRELPTMTMEEFEDKCKDAKNEWLVLNGFVLDFAEFKEDHPGGVKNLLAYRGKDATKAFEGGLNNHSQSARNLAAMYRIARIVKEDAAAEAEYVDEK